MHVLVGVGGTDRSFRALESAIERATAVGDAVTVAVIDDPESDADPEAVEAKARDLIGQYDLDADVRLLTGNPGAELVALAESEGFDELVIGDGKRTPMGKIQLDTITQYALFNSHVTVKVVR